MIDDNDFKLLTDNILILYPDLLQLNSRSRLECYHNVIIGQYRKLFSRIVNFDNINLEILIKSLQEHFDKLVDNKEDNNWYD